MQDSPATNKFIDAIAYGDRVESWRLLSPVRTNEAFDYLNSPLAILARHRFPINLLPIVRTHMSAILLHPHIPSQLRQEAMNLSISDSMPPNELIEEAIDRIIEIFQPIDISSLWQSLQVLKNQPDFADRPWSSFYEQLLSTPNRFNLHMSLLFLFHHNARITREKESTFESKPDWREKENQRLLRPLLTSLASNSRLLTPALTQLQKYQERVESLTHEREQIIEKIREIDPDWDES